MLRDDTRALPGPASVHRPRRLPVEASSAASAYHFEAELSAIEGMIAALPTTGGGITSGRSRVAGANAAVLLLGAIFEEFVRQEVRAVFSEKAAASANLSDLPNKIVPVVWKRSFEKLARTSLDDLTRDPIGLQARVRATIDFCISGDVKADVSDDVAHSENNMRPGELNKLFNQVGIKNMCGCISEFKPLQEYVGYVNAGKAKVRLNHIWKLF